MLKQGDFMFDTLAILLCLNSCLDITTFNRLKTIVVAMLAMTGRVTMLGISRWADVGGSYRTIQRFFNTPIAWATVHWCLIRHCFLDSDDTFLIAGDETIVTKAGDMTYGLDRFFSSIFGKTVPGLSFFTFSLISTKRRTSYPLTTQQMIHPENKTMPEDSNSTDQSKKELNKNKSNKKRGRGRPKGSKNKSKELIDLPPYLCFIQNNLKKVLQLIGSTIPIAYGVFDGAFGHNNALQMVRQCKIHIISKLQCNSALYFPYEGPYGGRGAKRKYGDKIDYNNIPRKYLKNTTTEKSIRIDIYQMTMLHKLFGQKLNVVIIVKTNLKTLASGHVVLFSSDLDLAYDKLIDYYKLRFQIEFNFRDAKQYWGLEDFMNVKETPVINAANLAFFMVNISQALIDNVRQDNPVFGVQDLKAYFRGGKYVNETLKLLPQKPDRILIQQIFGKITKIGGISVG